MLRQSGSLFELERLIGNRGRGFGRTESHAQALRKTGCRLRHIDAELGGDSLSHTRSFTVDIGDPISARVQRGVHSDSSESMISGSLSLVDSDDLDQAFESYDAWETVEPFAIEAPSSLSQSQVDSGPDHSDTTAQEPELQATLPNIGEEVAAPPAPAQPESVPPEQSTTPAGVDGSTERIVSDDTVLGQPVEAPPNNAVPIPAADSPEMAQPESLINKNNGVPPKEDFQEDLELIRQNDKTSKQNDEPVQPILSAPEAVVEKPLPQKQGTPGYSGADATSSQHSIFDRMAEANEMHSNTFDLGRLDLGKRLSEIESLIDQEESSPDQRSMPRQNFSASHNLDDDEVLKDISVISSLLEQKLREEQAFQETETDRASSQISLPEPIVPEAPVGSVDQQTDSKLIAEPSADLNPSSGAQPMTPQSVPPVASTVSRQPEIPAQTIVPPHSQSQTTEASPARGSDNSAVDSIATDAPDSTVDTEPEVTPKDGNSDGNSFGINYKVPLVAAGSDLPKAAAAAAMLTAWREQIPIDRGELIAGANPWHTYKEFFNTVDDAFYAAWGLVKTEVAVLTPGLLNSALHERGPLWIQPVANVETLQIVSGISGDGNTLNEVSFIDPTVSAADGSQAGVPTVQNTQFESFVTALGAGAVLMISSAAAE